MISGTKGRAPDDLRHGVPLRGGRQTCLLFEGAPVALFSSLRPNTYQDSLRLMRVGRALADLAGVDRVSLVMGTPANKDMLRKAGLDADSVDAAGPADLIVAAEVADV